VITVTSPSTVLPLESVNVQAVNSNFGDGTILNSTITWNFGDSGSEYNTLVGFNAAHAYANPGTYTITLSITTPDGNVGVTTTQVTIAPDNRPTIYVSPNGNDANDGSSPSDPVQSLAAVQNLLTSNERVLFQDGGVYSYSGANALNLGGLSHVYIGSYGSGAAPDIYYNGSAVGGTIIGLSNTSSGIVIQGLQFDTMYTNNNDVQAIPTAFIANGNDVSIIGCTFLNLGDDINMVLAPSNYLVQDNSSPNTSALNGYFGWVAGNDIVFLGNTVSGSSDEAVMRVAGVTDLELAYNNFTNPPENSSGTVSKNTLSTQVGQYVYAYQNIFAQGPANAGPLGTDVANPDVTLTDVVFDSNTINNTTLLITAGAEDVMIKNNVINANGDSGITINAQEIGGGFNWTVTNVWILNNTVTEPGQYGGFLAINDGEASNIVMDYNVFDDPNFQISSGQAFVTIDENDMNSFSQVLDNVWSEPAWISPWVNGGMFFVSSDISSQVGWLTPAEWEASGVASGDVIMNINLGSTYQVQTDGFTAGSSLANAS
jgi:hypothetical protein